jgi:hypothetical protein
MKRPALILVVCSSIWLPSPTAAQTVDLANSAGRRVITGTNPGGRAGTWLDRGDVSGDIDNKDLIVGSPDAMSGRGEVRVLFGWLQQTGDFDLGLANVVLTGGTAGDRFGASTNAGFITTRETNPESTARDLIVGAPGARGGRGEIYVFAGPLSDGSLTPANAVFRIIGAAGDQLGTIVQTADLNNDGFREIIAGAPATGRVYVIDYHSAPAASRDLSVQPATLTISGAGIGGVLTTGDVNADSIYDLAIGAPSALGGAGAVYIINGRSAPLPSSIALPGGANSTFNGFDAGDHAGSSLWIRDFDGAGRSDLVITAPDADGPGNSRPDCGEAYIIFGKTGQPAVLSPESTIYGAAAGYRTGTKVESGDVTRDEPDDLAFLAPGANGGFGEAYLYYGRSRAEFPAVVDLATGANRRVVGDATHGAIQTMVIWEVTGEGAEDLAFGVPSADSGLGRVYLSISPALMTDPQSVSLSAAQGTMAITTVDIASLGMPAVTWSARSNSSWLSVTPSGSVSAAAPSSATLTLDTSRLAVGTYEGSFVVASTSFDLTHALTVSVVFTVTPGSGGGTGGPTTNLFGLPTAPDEGAAGGVSTRAGSNVMVVPARDLLVRFTTVTSPGVTRVEIVSSTTERPLGNTVRYGPWLYKISTTAVYSGPVVIAIAYENFGAASQAVMRLYAGGTDITSRRDTTSHVIWSNNSGLPGTFFLAIPPPTLPAIRASTAFPAPVGIPITWTATANGGGGLLHYRFWRYNAASGWTIAQDYGPSNVYTWLPGRTDVGQYGVQVWIRRADSTANYDLWAGTGFFNLSAPAPVSIDSLTSSEPLPAPAGRRISWTVRARGGVGPLQYKFLRFSAGAWTVAQDYSPVATFSWQTASTDQGSFSLQAWVRSVDSAATYEAWIGTASSISAPQPLRVTALTPSVAPPVRAGTPWMFTASTSGGTGPLLFKFLRYSVASSAWTMVQDYSPSNTYVWTPNGGETGKYAVQVWVKNAGSAAVYDAWFGTAYMDVVAAAVQVTLASSLPSPAPAGSVLTWTASASGGTGSLEYKFWRYSQAAGTWTMVQDYGAANTYSWMTTSGNTGTFALQVWVRSVGSTATWEAWAGSGSFQITP